MNLIVGLGNPGKKYSQNRHNIGFKVVDWLAGRYSGRFKKESRQEAWLAQIKIGNNLFLLAKPATFMNNSGRSLVKILDRYKILVENLLLIYDDADLDLGLIRIRKSGSSGGHRGVISVINELGTEKVNRLKVGVGRNGCVNLADYVLDNFSDKEKRKLNKIVEAAATAALVWFEQKKEKTIIRE